ncbi:hypothetical protein ABW20_dc0102985 [Dactylellina cionopaga]|nr:hypothetical protein ABW20_dc0102985 [Dactylellina cionopaga]
MPGLGGKNAWPVCVILRRVKYNLILDQEHATPAITPTDLFQIVRTDISSKGVGIEIDPGINVHEVQSALNGVSFKLRKAMRGYKYTGHACGPMGFTGSSVGALCDANPDITFASNRRLVSEAKEPYWIEGPSTSRTWE